MPTDTIKWIEINWKVLNTINDNRSIIGSTEVEAIKQVMDEKHSASLKAKAKEASAASAAAKGCSQRRQASGSSGDLRVPKKARPSKFCQHCRCGAHQCGLKCYPT
jgi:hypothetical protein